MDPFGAAAAFRDLLALPRGHPAHRRAMARLRRYHHLQSVAPCHLAAANRVAAAQPDQPRPDPAGLLLRRAVDASEEERRRIAGTLHDGAVQELAGTSFTVAGAAENAAAMGQPELAAKLTTAAGAVRASIRGLRSLLVDIYPPGLTNAG